MGYVVCFVSVYTISSCVQCCVLVTFAYALTILNFFYLYLPVKAIRFFCCRIIKKVRGRRKLTFQTTAFRLVIRPKILFDRECKINPLLST